MLLRARQEMSPVPATVSPVAMTAPTTEDLGPMLTPTTGWLS